MQRFKFSTVSLFLGVLLVSTPAHAQSKGNSSKLNVPNYSLIFEKKKTAKSNFYTKTSPFDTPVRKEGLTQPEEMTPPISFWSRVSSAKKENYEDVQRRFNRSKELANQKDWKVLFEEGKKELASKFYGEALQLLSRAIESKKATGDVYYQRGLCFYQLGRYEDALKDYDTAFSMKTRSQALFLDRAAVLLKLKKFDQAIGDYENVLKLQPNNPDAIYGKSLSYFKTGKPDQSINLLTRLQKSHPGYWRAFLLAGDIYIIIGDMVKARVEYQKGIALKPDSVILNDRLGRLEMALGKYKDATKYFLKASEPANYDAKNNLGYCQYKSGDFEDSIDTFRQIDRGVIASNKLYAENVRRACLAYVEKKKKLLNQSRNKAEVYSDIAYGYTHMPDFSKAKEYAQKAVNLNPNNFRAQYVLGLSLGKSKSKADLEKAFQCLSRAIKLNSKSKSGWFARAEVALKLNRYDQSIKDYLNSEEIQPSYVNYLNLSLVTGKKRNEKKAEEYAIKAYNLNPNDSEVLERMAFCKFRLRKFDEGLLWAEKGLLANKDNPMLYRVKAILLEKLERYEEAFEAIEKAIGLKENVALYYLDRASICCCS